MNASHLTSPHRVSATPLLPWLAGEPYRVFFFSGAVWSVIGASLWPLFYAQKIVFYPGIAHARLMIEAFGGAFVVGFLGTAAPRMATAPKLTPLELIWLWGLHQASALCHLAQQPRWGDALFVALLGSLLLCLVIRVVRFRREAPPPQLLLALLGLACGITGAVLLLSPSTYADARRFRLAGLFLYQGFLLQPTLGIGSFVFPRMLGGDFGYPKKGTKRSASLFRAFAAGALIVASFFLEAFVSPLLGYALRVIVAGGYLFVEIRWRHSSSGTPRGSLSAGLLWALTLGALGLTLAPLHYVQHVSVEHLLYIGGFGLLMLVIGSRVLFGHSGDAAGALVRSKWVRFLIFLGVLTAITRATPAWRPSTTISHHLYAASLWMLLAICWLLWHRRRFITRDESD